MDKFINADGKVAVLVSPGFGAGWYTWNMAHPQGEQCLFDPEIVQMVLEGKDPYKIGQFAEKKYGDDFCTDGVRTLRVHWVEQGKKFYVSEYDGGEVCVTEDSMMEA